MTKRQFTLDFDHRPALGSDDFIVAGANRDAVAWIDRWPDWPTVGTVLVGPAGSGKTHLTNVWKSRSNARHLDHRILATSPTDALISEQPAIVFDGLDSSIGRAAETALLHVLNMLAERDGSVLLTARIAPAQLPLSLPDLASRVRAMPVVVLQQPDDALLGAVLRKLFADRQLMVGHDVIRYLVHRGERSFAAARGHVEALDRAALERKREVTVPLVRDILDEV